MYKGIAGSEGIGIGNVVIIEEHEIVIENKKITDTDAEIARLQGAIEKFVNDTNAMADRMEKTVGAKDADILRGHIQMLQDPTIEEQITALYPGLFICRLWRALYVPVCSIRRGCYD